MVSGVGNRAEAKVAGRIAVYPKRSSSGDRRKRWAGERLSAGTKAADVGDEREEWQEEERNEEGEDGEWEEEEEEEEERAEEEGEQDKYEEEWEEGQNDEREKEDGAAEEAEGKDDERQEEQIGGPQEEAGEMQSLEGVKRDIIEDYAEFGSKIYAPITREGNFPDSATKGMTMDQSEFEPWSYAELLEIEDEVTKKPAPITMAELRRYMKPRDTGIRRRKLVAAQLNYLNTLLEESKANHMGFRGYDNCWPCPLGEFKPPPVAATVSVEMKAGKLVPLVSPSMRTAPDSAASHPSMRKASIQSAGLVPNRLIQRPPTPTISGKSSIEMDRYRAATVLQRLLRGRAAQIAMDGIRSRRLELIRELQLGEKLANLGKIKLPDFIQDREQIGAADLGDAYPASLSRTIAGLLETKLDLTTGKMIGQMVQMMAIKDPYLRRHSIEVVVELAAAAEMEVEQSAMALDNLDARDAEHQYLTLQRKKSELLMPWMTGVSPALPWLKKSGASISVVSALALPPRVRMVYEDVVQKQSHKLVRDNELKCIMGTICMMARNMRKSDDFVLLDLDLIVNAVRFELENSYLKSFGEMLKQVFGIPIGRNSDDALACLVCAKSEALFLGSLGRDCQLVTGMRMIDDIAVFVGYDGSDKGSKQNTTQILGRFEECNDRSPHLVRKDEREIAFDFLGARMIIESSPVRIHIFPRTKNQRHLTASGCLKIHSMQDYFSFSSFSKKSVKKATLFASRGEQPFVPVSKEKQREAELKFCGFKWITKGQTLPQSNGNFLMQCKLCGQGFQGSQTKASQHFTIKNNCAKVSVEQLAEIWNKTKYPFDPSHHRKILDFLRSRGFRDNRNTSATEHAGEEECDDSEDERRAAEGVGDDGDSGAEDMDVRREAERARGKMRVDKAVDVDTTPDEGDDDDDDDEDEGADIGASLDGGLMVAGRRGQEGAARALREAAGSKKRKRKAKMTAAETKSAPPLSKKTKWWYVSGIPFEAARRPEYQTMRKKLLECPSYAHPALPTHRVISCDGIPQQQRVVADMVAAVRRDIEATGATILTDGRKSITSDQIVNFLAAGPTCAFLFRTVQRDGAVQETTEAVVERWKDVFDKFGVDKVNAICTDSASAYVAASKLLAKETSDIAKDDRNGQVGKREDTIIRARAVVHFIREHGAALSLYRRFSTAHPSSASMAAGSSSSAPVPTQRRGRELVYPVQTRFATHYLMLERLLDRHRALEALMMSDDWLQTAWRRSIFLQARWVRHEVRYAPFWEHVEDIVALMTPVMQVARARLSRTSKDELNIVIQACQARVAHMLEPAHCMAHILNPRHRSITFFGAARRTSHDRKLAEESLRYLRQQTGDNEDLYQTLRTQLAEFHSREGNWTYGGVEGDRDAASCKGEKETSQVGQWWVQHGDGAPLLQSIAIRLTHTWTCASPAERNWAVHERVQVKRRNQLGFIKLTRLVEISTNLRLSRCQGRGSGYVLPWEDAEEETDDAIPPPRDEGVRPADRVTEAQRDRQVQRAWKDRLSKESPSFEAYFGRRATMLMAAELESVYDPEPDPMAQDTMEAESWSDPDDLAVESEPGGSDDHDDDTPLVRIPRPHTRASATAAAPPPVARPPSSALGHSTDRRGHSEQGAHECVDEGDDGDDDEGEGYEGSSEDDGDPGYSPTRRHDDDDDDGGDGGQTAAGSRRSERQRRDRCSGAGRGGSGAGVGGAGHTGGASGVSGGRVRRESASSTRTVHWLDEARRGGLAEVGPSPAEVAPSPAVASAEDAAASTEGVVASAEAAAESAEVAATSAEGIGGSAGLPPTPAAERVGRDADAAATPVSQILRGLPSCSAGDISSSMLQEAAEGTVGSSGLHERAGGSDGVRRPVQQSATETEQDRIDREERRRAQGLARRCEMTQSIASRARVARMLETGFAAGDAEVECGGAGRGDAEERPASPVQGVCVLPLGGAMSVGELERQVWEDPLRADRRGRMDEAARRLMAEGPTFVPCSPSVPSSATNAITPSHVEGPRVGAAARVPSPAPIGESPSPESRKKKKREGKSLSTVRRVTQTMRESQPGLAGLHPRTRSALSGDVVADTAGWQERASTRATDQPMSAPAGTDEHAEHSAPPGRSMAARILREDVRAVSAQRPSHASVVMESGTDDLEMPEGQRRRVSVYDLLRAEGGVEAAPQGARSGPGIAHAPAGSTGGGDGVTAGGTKKHKTVAEKVKPAAVSRDRTGEATISEEEIADIIRKRKETEGQRITTDRLAKMDIGDGNLTDKEREYVAMTLRDCDKAIAFDESKRGRIDPRYAKPARIHTIPHVPWKDRPRWKYAQKEKEEIVAFLKEKIRTFVVEPCESAYSNKWFFLRKGGSNKLRWIQDLQRTNAVTIRDVGSIPEADLLAEGSAGRSIYSICDLFSGYDEIPLDYRDRHMTAMHTPLGLVQMMVMPMGWTNGVAVFQRSMITVLKKFIPDKVEVFLYDFPIKRPIERDETEVLPGVRKFVADHMTDPTIARWMIHIRLYDYRVERISGTKNQVADGLAQLPIREEDYPRLEEAEAAVAKGETIRVASNRARAGVIIREVRERREIFLANLYDGKYRDIGLYLTGREEGTEAIKKEALGYCLRVGHLFKRPTKFAIPMRVLCDPEERKAVIEELHDGIVGGHRGVKGTFDKVRRLYWWDGQYVEVEKYCSTSETCQKRATVRYKEPLVSSLPSAPGDKVHIDLVTMPKGVGGLRYMINARDDLTGFVEAKAIKKTTEECHCPQNGDGELLTANDVHLRNGWDDINGSGSDNDHDNHDDDDDDDHHHHHHEDDDEDNDDHDDDQGDDHHNDDDADNGVMKRWNQKTGDGDNEGDKELLESPQIADDDEVKDNGGMDRWNQRTAAKERENESPGLGGTLYWDKKRSEDRRVDFKDSGDLKGSEQEGKDNSVGKTRTWMGTRREWRIPWNDCLRQNGAHGSTARHMRHVARQQGKKRNRTHHRVIDRAKSDETTAAPAPRDTWQYTAALRRTQESTPMPTPAVRSADDGGHALTCAVEAHSPAMREWSDAERRLGAQLRKTRGEGYGGRPVRHLARKCARLARSENGLQDSPGHVRCAMEATFSTPWIMEPIISTDETMSHEAHIREAQPFPPCAKSVRQCSGVTWIWGATKEEFEDDPWMTVVPFLNKHLDEWGEGNWAAMESHCPWASQYTFPNTLEFGNLIHVPDAVLGQKFLNHGNVVGNCKGALLDMDLFEGFGAGAANTPFYKELQRQGGFVLGREFFNLLEERDVCLDVPCDVDPSLELSTPLQLCGGCENSGAAAEGGDLGSGPASQLERVESRGNFDDSGDEGTPLPSRRDRSVLYIPGVQHTEPVREEVSAGSGKAAVHLQTGDDLAMEDEPVGGEGTLSTPQKRRGDREDEFVGSSKKQKTRTPRGAGDKRKGTRVEQDRPAGKRPASKEQQPESEPSSSRPPIDVDVGYFLEYKDGVRTRREFEFSPSQVVDIGEWEDLYNQRSLDPVLKPTPGTRARRLKPEEWKDELAGQYYYYAVCGQHNAAAARSLLGSEVAKRYNFERWPAQMLYFSDEDFDGYFLVSSQDNKKDHKTPPRQLKLSMKDIRWQWKHDGCPRAVMGNPSGKQAQVRDWRKFCTAALNKAPHNALWLLADSKGEDAVKKQNTALRCYLPLAMASENVWKLAMEFFEVWETGRLLSHDGAKWIVKKKKVKNVKPGVTYIHNEKLGRKEVVYNVPVEPPTRKGKKEKEEGDWFVQVPDPDAHCWKAMESLTDSEKCRVLRKVLACEVVWLQSGSPSLAKLGKLSVHDMVHLVKCDRVLVRLWNYYQFKHEKRPDADWSQKYPFLKSRAAVFKKFESHGLDGDLWDSSRKHVSDSALFKDCPPYLGCEDDHSIEATEKLAGHKKMTVDWRNKVLSVLTGSRLKSREIALAEGIVHIKWRDTGDVTSIAPFGNDPLEADIRGPGVELKDAVAATKSHTFVLDLCEPVDLTLWKPQAWETLNSYLQTWCPSHWTMVVFVPRQQNLSFLASMHHLSFVKLLEGKWVRRTQQKKSFHVGNNLYTDDDRMYILFKGDDLRANTSVVYEGRLPKGAAAAVRLPQRVTLTDVSEMPFSPCDWSRTARKRQGSVYGDMERNPTQFLALLEFLSKKGEGVVFLGKPHVGSVWELLKAHRHVVAMEGNSDLLQFTMQLVKSEVNSGAHNCEFMVAKATRNRVWNDKTDMWFKLSERKRNEIYERKRNKIYDFLFLRTRPRTDTDAEYVRCKDHMLALLDNYHSASRLNEKTFLERLQSLYFVESEQNLKLASYASLISIDDEEATGVEFDADAKEEESDTESLDLQYDPPPAEHARGSSSVGPSSSAAAAAPLVSPTARPSPGSAPMKLLERLRAMAIPSLRPGSEIPSDHPSWKDDNIYFLLAPQSHSPEADWGHDMIWHPGVIQPAIQKGEWVMAVAVPDGGWVSIPHESKSTFLHLARISVLQKDKCWSELTEDYNDLDTSPSKGVVSWKVPPPAGPHGGSWGGGAGSGGDEGGGGWGGEGYPRIGEDGHYGGTTALGSSGGAAGFAFGQNPSTGPSQEHGTQSADRPASSVGSARETLAALVALGGRAGGASKSAGIRSTSVEEPPVRSTLLGDTSPDPTSVDGAARDENLSPERERRPLGLQREAARAGSGHTETTKSAEIRTSSGGGCRPGKGSRGGNGRREEGEELEEPEEGEEGEKGEEGKEARKAEEEGEEGEEGEEREEPKEGEEGEEGEEGDETFACTSDAEAESGESSDEFGQLYGGHREDDVDDNATTIDMETQVVGSLSVEPDDYEVQPLMCAVDLQKRFDEASVVVSPSKPSRRISIDEVIEGILGNQRVFAHPSTTPEVDDAGNVTPPDSRVLSATLAGVGEGVGSSRPRRSSKYPEHILQKVPGLTRKQKGLLKASGVDVEIGKREHDVAIEECLSLLAPEKGTYPRSVSRSQAICDKYLATHHAKGDNA
ncbi:hypothetical protein CBR_g26321 [Chara braunii]|uniref:DUF659 domain-containing protein n=1 Tax=Chara braunii TaxID=69332 RepID=A0A388L7J0_CHABU|nr:hypothetical protein CBR_g26321 [Chara braunii]|eukprot:GBG78291.1 hypothetical protein CBR_g26321 [Chara braunii]